MQTQYIETLMGNLATNSGLTISLNKIRGDNGHHVCESAFKALSRALRNLLDGTNTNTESAVMNELWGVGSSESYSQSIQLQRSGKIERKTKETSILVELYLDGGAKGISVETGLPTLNEFWTLLATEANISLIIQCSGDLWVDDHHTTEDVAIAVGQVLNKALGTKAGLNRMWCAKGTYGDADVEVTMDLSNRPCLTHNLTFADSGEEYVGGALTVEMMDHALESLVMNGHMTVHIVEEEMGKSVKETAFAAAAAFGKALRYCSAVDPRRAGKTASSKGTLSV
jgi:imidazoleglycerol-phosphate dehydratase